MNPTDPFVQLYGHLDAALLADEQFVSEFKNSATLLKVQKGDYLLRAGEVCSEGYFINKGLFVLFVYDIQYTCSTNVLHYNPLFIRA